MSLAKAALRASPAVTSFSYQSKEDAYAESEEQRKLRIDGRSDSSGVYSADNSPRAFYGTLRHSTDYARVAEELKSIRGVLDVVRAPTDFWQGKADVAVTLCGSSSIEICAGRMVGGITDDQKRAILDRLHGIPEVDAIYFEDRSHALEVARHYWPESAGGAVLMADQMGESFYVKLNNPRPAEAVGRALKGYPGVQGVRKIALN